MDFTYPTKICFECNLCGLCCGDTENQTRHILLLESEAENISSQICLPIEDFAQELVTKSPYIYEIKKPKDGKCFFLKDKQCNIYQSRPLICRFYPFELKFNQEKNTHTFNFTLECPAIGEGRILNRKDFEELFLLAKQRLL